MAKGTDNLKVERVTIDDGDIEVGFDEATNAGVIRMSQKGQYLELEFDGAINVEDLEGALARLKKKIKAAEQ